MIIRPPFALRSEAHLLMALMTFDDGTSGSVPMLSTTTALRGVGHLRPLLVDPRHLGEQPDAGVVQHGHLVARAGVGHVGAVPAAVAEGLQRDQRRGLTTP